MKRQFQFASALVVALALSCIASRSVQAETFDAVADYSATINPNGTWSYGYIPGDSLTISSMIKYTDPSHGDWRDAASDTDPNVGSDGTHLLLGPFQGPSVVQWTSPVNGTIDITSLASNEQVCCDGNQRATNYLVFDNNTQIFAQHLPGLHDSIAFDKQLNVNAGDTISFVAYNNGGDNNTLTLTADITITPEPATIVGLCGMGAVGLALVLRRRYGKGLRIGLNAQGKSLVAVSVAVVVAAACTLQGSSASAETFSLANDFSITNNGTNGNNWSYGEYTTGLTPSSFSKFTVTATNVFGALDVWSTGGSDPNLEKNTTGTDNAGCCGAVWPAGQVAFGPFAGPTVARFTAPTTGAYTLSASFLAIQDSRNNVPDGYVYETTVSGSTQLVDVTGIHRSIAAGGDGAIVPFNSKTLDLTAGDTLDFVTWGGNANNATTEVIASVTELPEPSTVAALCGMGAMGLIWALRRKNRQTA